MSARLTGPFQRTKQEQAGHLQVACASKKGSSSWTLRQHYNRFRVFSEGPYGKESEENDAVAKDTSQQFIAVTQDSPEMVTMAQNSEEVLAVSQVSPELIRTIQLPDD